MKASISKERFFFPTSHASLANLIYFPSKYMYFSRLTVTPLSVELKSHFINSEYEFEFEYEYEF